MDQHRVFESTSQSPAPKRGHLRHVPAARPRRVEAEATDARFDEVWEELYPLTYSDDAQVRAWAWTEVKCLQHQRDDPSWTPEPETITVRLLLKLEDAAPGLHERVGALIRGLRKPA